MNKNATKKSILVVCILLLVPFINIYAQQNKALIDAAFSDEVKKNGSSAVDVNDYLITDQYTDKSTGFTHTYVQQRYHNIAVFNAISIFLIKDDKLVYFKPGLIDNIQKKIKTDKPSVTAEAAIAYALYHLGRTNISPVKLINTDTNLNRFTFESTGLSASPVTVQLVYRVIDENVYLAWDVSIEMKNEPHWWNIRVNALTGDFIDKNDLTASCDFGDNSNGFLAHLKQNKPANHIAFSFLPPLVPAYNVFPFPIEAPSFGSRSLLTDPSDLSASPYGWLDVDGVAGNEYTITRGNNVYAYEDANNDNLPGYSPGSATLQFNFPFTSGAAPLTNQDAAITNLFYVNNKVHDLLYHFGFDEDAGNFQKNNYGHGGQPNDYVKAEAFDGSGTNNANFSTPPDGISGRMQMYLWSGTPQLDGSFDNGVIAHEYGHGVSNRLTGGPSQANCLSNAEQGGEGWSDWLALMMTIEPGDNGAMARGIGTYVKGQATTGAGLRRFPYSTNMTINPQTYANVATNTEAHAIGEIWCDAIWDMSWFLINDLGYNSDPTVATAGNNIAMRLVLEGMKLQPCNPGFLDARDGILLADATLYNNAHRCRIWEAFARRGMGYNATQGLSTSATDQVAGFSMPPYCLAATQVPVAAFTSDVSTVSCGGAVKFTDQSTQPFSWAWNFGDQTTSTLQNPTHNFTAPGTYVVTLVVTNPMGSNSVTHNITVTSTFAANITATPATVCSGSPVQLNAVASGSTYITYAVTSIPYAPLTGTATNVALNDDAMSTVKPIGFNFKFFGQTYSNFYICSNGYITFSSGQSTTAVYGSIIPSTGSPNNFIALAWNDLYPQGIANAVSYFNTGVSPNRKLVVQYNTRHYGGAAYPFVVQAILSEGSNEIEIHTTTISDASAFDEGATTTQGVENATGTAGVGIPGRNGTIFSASNDAYKFTPLTPYSYNWQPGNLNGPTQIVNPVSTGSYAVNIADGTGCVQTFNSPVITVNSCVTTLNLKLFLEGFYSGAGTMRATQFDLGMTTDATATDNITVNLWSVANLSGNSPDYSLATVLHNNGTATLQFPAAVNGNSFYIAVKHRNSIETWSKLPVSFTGTTTYDFSTSLSRAYDDGINPPMIIMAPAVYAIYSGDVNQDGSVDASDMAAIDNDNSAFAFGYNVSDTNGDGATDASDISIVDNNQQLFLFYARPY